MKNFKILITTILAVILCVTVNSCKKVENFLEKAPGEDLTEANLFTSVNQLDRLVTTIYLYGLHQNMGWTNNTLSPTNGISEYNTHPTSDMSDESDLNEQTFGPNILFNQGTVSPANIVNIDNKYYQRFIALRQIAVLIKNIDNVPDITPAYKAQVIAEVKCIRAFMYLEMVQRYGGVPIITDTFDPGIAFVAPRNSIEECFNFIVSECDEAINSNALPPVQTSVLQGRITSIVPFAIKSRALLYAASPKYNIAIPYLSMVNSADNKLLCYGNFDARRWDVAAAAALAGLNKAREIGVALVFGTNEIDRIGRYPGDIDPLVNPRNPNTLVPLGTVPTRGNYELSWSIHNNSEIILTFQGHGNVNNAFNDPFRNILPQAFGTTRAGVAGLMNHVKKYEKLDGTPQTWPATGTNLAAKNRELDPRFKQSLIYNNGYFGTGRPIFELAVEAAATTGRNSLGHWMRKMLPININQGNLVPLDIILRLNELYLNYAEAKNEADANASSTDFSTARTNATLDNTVYTPNIYDAVNVLRARSGMPNLPILSQSNFRTRVRNERAVELAFDGHRLWDISRWLIAEEDGVMRGLMEKMTINRAGGTAPNFNYNWTISQHEIRTFNKNMYSYPFPLTEVQKGGIVQNPGW
ncbi:hypothetical protein A5893_13155 [Pedobacter psychrophilus]|uniref:RagB/SusD domain-containing protein n=1 Tax=Pedobacter psychrophilus TaxID=1826909 RepID=A0A179DE53_9SPHI|nr:RagB/SusD family nutrient uptake outer membrane protein [Pedobacter psychrophilus]OAQ38980.1 hypothetical protein A5893_13155 [Pedobacter psychrophilus]